MSDVNTLLVKICFKCKCELPATREHFHVNARGKYGLQSRCKKCTNEKLRAAYKPHPNQRETKTVATCKFCGKQFETYHLSIERGKKFCSKDCGYKASITVTEKCCEICGKVFAFAKRRISRQRFCSYDCFVAHKLLKQVPIECLTCGKDFTVIPSRAKKAKYCSVECQQVITIPAMRAANPIKYNSVFVNCQLCGKKYLVNKARLKRTRFCSHSCLSLYNRATNPTISKVERRLGEAMAEKGFTFEAQAVLCSVTVADFFFREIGLVIFVDGDYWHGSTFPEQENRDRRINARLAESGYMVKRFWEREINDNIEAVLLTLEEAVEDLCFPSPVLF